MITLYSIRLQDGLSFINTLIVLKKCYFIIFLFEYHFYSIKIRLRANFFRIIFLLTYTKMLMPTRGIDRISFNIKISLLKSFEHEIFYLK